MLVFVLKMYVFVHPTTCFCLCLVTACNCFVRLKQKYCVAFSILFGDQSDILLGTYLHGDKLFLGAAPVFTVAASL